MWIVICFTSCTISYKLIFIPEAEEHNSKAKKYCSRRRFRRLYYKIGCISHYKFEKKGNCRAGHKYSCTSCLESLKELDLKLTERMDDEFELMDETIRLLTLRVNEL